MSSSDKTPKDSPQTSFASSSSCVTCGKGLETSVVVSESKADDNSSNIEFVEKFLECSICLGFPASPIHSCDNAHILCGQCAPKFSACPTCQNPKLSPSPLGEKLAREAKKKIECPNLEAGCKDGVLSTKFADHLALCYFREITCFKVGCDVKVRFHEYTKHLGDVHDKEIQIGPKFTQYYRYNKSSVMPGKMWSSWGHIVINYESQDFIVHAKVSRQSLLFLSWVSVLGDKDLADKYSCDIKFKDPNASNEFGCSWRLPVLAFHEIPSNESEAKLLGYSAVAAVPIATIEKWTELDKNGLLRIFVTYEIRNA